MSTPPEPSSRPVTLRQIAARAGVSHVTVSLALRGHPRIPAERRASLVAMAEEMGYRPDPGLRALQAYRRAGRIARDRHVIAWINRWLDPDSLLAHAEFHEYLRGASQAADAMGFGLEEFRVPPTLPLARLERILRARDIRGIIIPPHPMPLDWTDFDFSGFSAVRIGYSQPHPPVHRVTSDQFHHGQLAATKLTERGCRRVGFVGSSDRLRRFLAGYRHWQEEVGESSRLPPLIVDLAEPGSHVQALSQWAKRHQPDGIVSDLRETKKLCAAAGLDVPGRCSVAALSVRDGGANAGIDQHPREIGRAAAEWLVARAVSAPGLPPVPMTTTVSGTWIDGSDCPSRG